jgi:DnaJ-domain-containing protein 1
VYQRIGTSSRALSFVAGAMGIFERLVELARSNATPLDVEPELGDLHDVSGSWIEEAPRTAAAPDVVARWYVALELPIGSGLASVRSSYRRLLFRFHPDKFASDPEKQRMATELTRGLTTAYRGLTAHLGG